MCDALVIRACTRHVNDRLARRAGQFSRILPMFETGSNQYAWLNRTVSVGVYRPTPGKIAFRVYRIL